MCTSCHVGSAGRSPYVRDILRVAERKNRNSNKLHTYILYTYIQKNHIVNGTNSATPCEKYIGLARPMFSIVVHPLPGPGNILESLRKSMLCYS